MITAAGGVEESIVARIRCGWKKFKELLPVSGALFSMVLTPGQ